MAPPVLSKAAIPHFTWSSHVSNQMSREGSQVVGFSAFVAPLDTAFCYYSNEDYKYFHSFLFDQWP